MLSGNSLRICTTATSRMILDISVGLAWRKHWSANGYDAQFGMRMKFAHNYPNYFPQAWSSPQDAWCYPEDALPTFKSGCEKSTCRKACQLT